MRRRGGGLEDLPAHLAAFVPAEWGWSGPEVVDGKRTHGYQVAHAHWLGARARWRANPGTPDWLADVIRNNPDSPWPAA